MNIYSTPDIKLSISRGKKEVRHMHSELEIIYVLMGNLTANDEKNQYLLEKDGIILFNANDPHGLFCKTDTIICQLWIPYRLFTDVFISRDFTFFCNSTIDAGKAYNNLKEIIKKFIECSVEKQHKTNCLYYGLTYQLMDELIENFQKGSTFKEGGSSKRMDQIIDYVKRNFHSHISLNELADELYVSVSTLSRLFKKHTNLYFKDYVKRVRLQYAVNQLLSTDHSITMIAVDSGFSNPSAFNKDFQNMYSMTPSEYRKKMQQKQIHQEKEKYKENEQIKMEVRKILKASELMDNAVSLDINAKNSTQYEKSWNKVINIGSVYNMTLANLQYHTIYLSNELHFKYVRMWNIFSSRLMPSDAASGNYNFSKIDEVLDFLVNNKLIPFLDFGVRPDCTVRSEGETVYFEWENIRFTSKKSWENMFDAFINHIVRRYGKEETEKWIYEFTVSCNNENRYYFSDDYLYSDVFSHGYNTIKQKMPSALVGGSGISISDEPNGVRKFIYDCKQYNLIPDFVSIVVFPYKHFNEAGHVYGKRQMDINSIKEQIESAKNELEKYGNKSIRLFVTEWSSTFSNRNYLNDGCFRGAFVLKTISDIWSDADLMCVWMGSDWVSNYYDTEQIANGGSGLITKDSIHKPVYYAYQFLNALGDKLISKGNYYIVTMTRPYDFEVILFNFKWYNYSYYMRKEDSYKIEELGNLFDNKKKLKVELNLNGLPNGMTYIIKTRSLNENHGSLLAEWRKFQFEKELERSDVKYLREVCIPDLSMEEQKVKDGNLTLKRILGTHEMMFIHIFAHEP